MSFSGILGDDSGSYKGYMGILLGELSRGVSLG